MVRDSFANRFNLDMIEDAYRRWQIDPGSVDDLWRAFFAGFELNGRRPSGPPEEDTAQTGVVRLIFAYRDLGHFEAHLDPLNPPPPPFPLLSLEQFGLKESHLNKEYDASAYFGMRRAKLKDLLAALRETYCRTIGVEFMHIQDINVRAWLRERMEPTRNQPNHSVRQKIRTLMNLHFAELFEKFLHTRYVGQKRFSLEGAETLIPVLDAIVEKAPSLGAQELVIGMAHRGRLNVLANILHKPYQDIFTEFEDNFLPDSIDGDGDVKYHLGFSSDVTTSSGAKVHLSLTPNPSHLEAVNPVVEGRTRAKQRIHGDTARKRGIPLLIHGDAAFAGQGIVAETLNLSELTGYSTGGTIHIIVNNQIGFTTSPTDARSTKYCTDVAKMIQAPIFHVNAEDPEAAVFVAELAFEFRQQFARDVIIDLYCYRKHGHNEGDEPSFTQPLMYKAIRDRASISAIYTEKLIKDGTLKEEEARAIDHDFQDRLTAAQLDVKSSPPRQRGMARFGGLWKGLTSTYTHDAAETAVPLDRLKRINEHLTRVPNGFTLNSKVLRLLEQKRNEVTENRPLDWAAAEAYAFGSLLLEGKSVRLSGQDSRRGTFSQRHAALYDANTGERFVPLSTLGPGTFDVFDSLLSEAAVLGFEYGYSLDDPNSLVLWEAQFGDFANGAQTIIDQFIVSGESKWQRSSGLVLLLPHGYEGQGPEHSSARLERFLQSCAEDNIQVCNLTTPAQYFHVLRRQLHRSFRKPLVIMTPKSLLRHKDAVSPLEALVEGRFAEVIDDPTMTPDKIRRVLVCSGKVYYDLAEERARKKRDDTAIIRLEQFYPFPEQQLKTILSRYRGVIDWVWVQEESQNMGGWSFIEPRLRALNYPVDYVGRDASASPATGSLSIHTREQRELVEAAFTARTPYLVRGIGKPTERPGPSPGAKTGEPTGTRFSVGSPS